MPKFPNFSNRVNQVGGSVFERFRPKMAAQGDNLVKLHIGDTYLPTKYPLPINKSMREKHEDYNRYCNTFGIEGLREALADKLTGDNNLNVDKSNILITCGATNALCVSVSALVEPNDEVIILTPAWPFFFGMVKIAGGKIIEIPFYMKLYESPDTNIVDLLSQHISPKTVAIYLNTPNNPSGKVLSRAQIEQVAQVTQKYNLWLISDEAYDGLTFDGKKHSSIASLPDMFERTLTVFTFSKSFMFAGLRLGYLVGNSETIKNINKIMVHQLYSPATFSQQMMIEPVKTRHTWWPEVRAHYQDLRDILVNKLNVNCYVPEAGYFIFFPADPYLHGRDYWDVIEACLDAGVSLATGDSFGNDFNNYIRLCFTGEPEERLVDGIVRLNKILG